VLGKGRDIIKYGRRINMKRIFYKYNRKRDWLDSIISEERIRTILAFSVALLILLYLLHLATPYCE
jgi:uncharacterized membrane protein